MSVFLSSTKNKFLTSRLVLLYVLNHHPCFLQRDIFWVWVACLVYHRTKECHIALAKPLLHRCCISRTKLARSCPALDLSYANLFFPVKKKRNLRKDTKNGLSAHDSHDKDSGRRVRIDFIHWCQRRSSTRAPCVKH